MNNKNTRRLVETAVMLALATLFSMIQLYKAPFGGSVTLVSMLPVIVVAYRYGTKWGILSGLTYGALQLVVGLDALRGVSLTTFVGSLFLDYLLAFGMCALGATFRKMKSQKIGLPLGVFMAGAARFVCHYLSGILLWSVYAQDYGMMPAYYSLVYNGGYMLPETLITIVAAVLLSLVLDFRNENITDRSESAVRV